MKKNEKKIKKKQKLIFWILHIFDLSKNIVQKKELKKKKILQKINKKKWKKINN